jgi:hypothetical protein
MSEVTSTANEQPIASTLTTTRKASFMRTTWPRNSDEPSLITTFWPTRMYGTERMWRPDSMSARTSAISDSSMAIGSLPRRFTMDRTPDNFRTGRPSELFMRQKTYPGKTTTGRSLMRSDHLCRSQRTGTYTSKLFLRRLRSTARSWLSITVRATQYEDSVFGIAILDKIPPLTPNTWDFL